MLRVGILKFLLLLLLAFPLREASAQVVAQLICDGNAISTGGTFTVRAVISGLQPGITYREDVITPAGFQTISEKDGSFIAEGESRMKVYVLSVDDGVAAGAYDLEYRLSSDESGLVSVLETSCQVVVPRVESLELTLVNGHFDVYRAGETSELRLVARNLGNAPIKVELGIYIGNVGHIREGPTVVELPPGESAELPFEVNWRNDSGFVHEQSVYATAYAGAGTTRRIVGSTSRTISVIPDAPERLSKWWKIPSQLELFGVSDGQASDAFLEYKGNGSWSEESEHGLSWLVRTPSSGVRGSFHTQDRYSLRFFGPEYDLLLGDHTFTLSQLTEHYYFGRGASATYAPEGSGIEVKLLGHSEAFDFEEENRFGAYLKLLEDDTGSFLKFNYLRRDLQYISRYLDPENEIFSIDSNLSVNGSMDVFGEFAYSKNPVSDNDSAFRFGSRGAIFERIRYNVEAIEAGETFFGFYSDSRHYDAGVAGEIDQNLSVSASWNYADVNLSGSAGRPRGIAQLLTAGPKLRLSDDWSISIEAVDFYRRHKSRGPSYDYAQESVKMQLYHHRNKLAVSSTLEIGKQFNNVTGESEDLTIYGLGARYSFLDSLSADIKLEYGQDRFNEFPATSLRVSGGFRYEPVESVEIDLRGNWTDYKDVTAREQITLNARAGYRFENDHVVRAGLRWMQGKRRNIFNPGQQFTSDSQYYYVSYAIPFGAPVKFRSNTGAIAGVVGVGAGDGEFSGIEGLVLSIEGKEVVTDGQGRFAFQHMQPGVYVLRIDQSSMGASKVAGVPTPMIVEVQTGQETVLEIPVYEAAVISGNVQTLAGSQFQAHSGFIPSATVPITDFSGMFVSISGPFGDQSIPLDASGSFEVYGLPPGEWTVEIMDFAIPHGYEVSGAARKLVLKEGQEVRVELDLKPIYRRLRIIDEGFLSNTTE